jgi:hypothetical protein
MAYETYSTLRTENLDEESRLRYRDEIQQILAGIEVKRARLAELEAVISAIGDASEAAALEHSAICDPLQAELASLDEQHVQAIRAKQPLPSELAARRVEILKQIADENTRLELQVQANKKSEQKLRREWEAVRMETIAAGALENVLIRLASAGLRNKLAITDDRLQWARRRQLHEQSLVDLNRSRIDSERNHQHPDARNIQLYESRLAGHQLVAADAAAEVADLNGQVAQLRAEMLAE